jgi:dihydrofolate reductase
MSSIYVDLSMSIDGFIAGPRVGIDRPMGDRGEQLHEWMFAGKSSEQARAFEDERFASTGALIMGRTMVDLGVRPWGEDPVFHAPVFVVTHRAAEPIVKQGGTTYTFVTAGPDAALRSARAAAGEQEICVAGGASIARLYLNAGVVDQMHLHVVPILLGAGTRLFTGEGRPADLSLRHGASGDMGVVHLEYHLEPT